MSLKRQYTDDIQFDSNKKTMVDGETKIISFSDDSDDGDEAYLEEVVFGGTVEGSDEKETTCGFYIDKLKSSSGETSQTAAWNDDDDFTEEPETKNKKSKRPGLGNMRFRPLLKSDRKTEYEKTVGEAPEWSKLDSVNSKLEKDEEDLLTIRYDYVTASQHLSKSVLEINRCADVNKQQPSQKALEACEFHKSAQLALTAASDCRLNLFQVDGKCNQKIHSFFVEQFPIKCAHFLTSGEEILMTSSCHWFYSYDMISGKIIKIPNIKGTEDRSLTRFLVSPDGKHLVFISKYGHMHIVSSSTKELIRTIKVNGNVNDVTFSKEGQNIFAFGDEGIVTMWDIRSHSCFHSFYDEGCTNGTSLATSPNGKYVACGSRSGFVNVYDELCFSTENPKPIGTIKNLRYPVDLLKYNPTSEILAMASSEAENALKLIHLPSHTVFSNFPGKKNNLKLPREIDFSPNSGYFMVGNHKGRAQLFRLGHYKSY
ncbi:U3 small nucleolar RNA-associated protein 18 homolog [Styela clava]